MYNLTNLASSNCGWICILNNQKSCSNFILKIFLLYSIYESTSIKLNFKYLYIKQVSLSSSYYDLTFFNDSFIFRHISFILYLEEKLLCVLIIDNCSKSGLFYSLHDYTLLCMLFFRKNFQPTITRQKKEIKKKLNRICLPSFPSKESCSFLLYFTASVRPWL